ncbi:M48 family metalloprotease [Litoribrevibacter albus]|uniref:Putative beta-barrel assembly-enhancing protease n=1 Tax=Litoribrevibacter albus TaxID=1473156 RepID=A0AA37SAS6_9GAMM|nr:M48 family metalloprotease [Litoribrevibacter albus]GLQ31236.1 putative beta-barrel assembly-enhancing protease [Litoribrevibacter albus]
MIKTYRFSAILCVFLIAFQSVVYASNQLPSLGDSTSGFISLEQEHKLGRGWLRALRNQTPTLEDPLINDYLEYTIYRLVENSQLTDRRLETIVVDNNTLNAFAVPGGVIGVNTGLFLYSNSEGEFSSVLSHELAHISQRHFARRVQEAEQRRPLTMVGLLASVLLAVTTGGTAAIAAGSTTYAASAQAELAFSRDMEQEADRIGMDTLYKSGYSPHDMTNMFKSMNEAKRFWGTNPPEYLLTHPLTESRISDSANRASQYTLKQSRTNFEFQLMKRRAEIHTISSSKECINKYQDQAVNAASIQQKSAFYALAICQMEDKQYDTALKTLGSIQKLHPMSITLNVLKAEILSKQEKLDESEAVLKKLLADNPDNYVITMYLANTYGKNGKARQAAFLLQDISYRRPNDPHVWTRLAEAHRINNNQIGYYKAAAEYYQLNGDFTNAQRQLMRAVKLAEFDFHEKSIIEERIKYIESLKTEFNQ